MLDRAPALAPARIMIVDDDPIVRRTIDRVLSAQGYVIVQADSAEQGLELLKQAEVDLVIADMHMPGLDGLRFLLHVRAIWPSCAALLMTASRSSDVRSFIYSGFDAAQLVRKTITDEELYQVVGRALRGRAGHDA